MKGQGDVTNHVLLNKINANLMIIEAHRPLTAVEVRELDAYYRIETTYSSNALEGNSLTLSEAKVLLEDGITVGGKPIRDCYETTGHANAYDHMLSMAREEDFQITENAIRQLHYLLYCGINAEGAGRYRKGQVYITGTDYVPPPPEDVPGQMANLISEFTERKDHMHPVVFAAYAHRRLVDILPFHEGNGRIARLLMNLILVRSGYCIVTISPSLRADYVSALQQAQRRDSPSDTAFIRLIAECELEAQRDYFRMFHFPPANRE